MCLSPLLCLLICVVEKGLSSPSSPWCSHKSIVAQITLIKYKSDEELDESSSSSSLK